MQMHEGTLQARVSCSVGDPLPGPYKLLVVFLEYSES